MITTEKLDTAAVQAKFKEATIRVIQNDPVGLHNPKNTDDPVARTLALLAFLADPKKAKDAVRKQYESYLASWTPEELLFIATEVCTEMAMGAIVSRLKEVFGKNDEEKL